MAGPHATPGRQGYLASARYRHRKPAKVQELYRPWQQELDHDEFHGRGSSWDILIEASYEYIFPFKKCLEEAYTLKPEILGLMHQNSVMEDVYA